MSPEEQLLREILRQLKQAQLDNPTTYKHRWRKSVYNAVWSVGGLRRRSAISKRIYKRKPRQN